MKHISWDKIRILVTNKCNYKCSFCHNEGQKKDRVSDAMSFDDFKTFIDIIKDQPLSELNFSGGEPFLNKDICEMIKYACDNLNCDISCATNLSLISNNQIDKLSGTRVKFNIQFPYISHTLFQESTGNGKLSKIIDRIEKVKNQGIDIGLNCVVQTADNDIYEEIILFAIDKELPLKLLPQMGKPESCDYKQWLYPILKKYSIDYKDKKTGATRWVLANKGKNTVVLYIDSPCFTKDIEQCRKYGELRILPNFFAQPCINRANGMQLDIKNKSSVLANLTELWRNFTQC